MILNYRRSAETLACVSSVRRDDPRVEIIVVDNGAHDADTLAEALPGDVVLLHTDHNLGYAGGNNLGMSRALAGGADMVLVLNNDVVVQPGCIDALREATERHPDWGIIGPMSLLADAPDRVDFVEAEVDIEHLAVRAYGRDGPVTDAGFHDRATDYVTGSAMLFRREVLDRVGLFDERFFLVWEDVDICVRARAAGFACGATPSATVLHGRSVTFGGDASPLQRYFFARNSFLLARKHLRPPQRWKTELLLVRRYRTWGKGDTPLHRAIRKGLWDGLQGRWGPPRAVI